MAEDRDVRIRRLRYRASHTGMREIDLILGGFAKAHLADLADRDLDGFEGLLTHSEADLFTWIAGSSLPPDSLDRSLLQRIQAFQPSTSL
jgi:antitoxin CptB